MTSPSPLLTYCHNSNYDLDCCWSDAISTIRTFFERLLYRDRLSNIELRFIIHCSHYRSQAEDMCLNGPSDSTSRLLSSKPGSCLFVWSCAVLSSIHCSYHPVSSVPPIYQSSWTLYSGMQSCVVLHGSEGRIVT